MRKIKIIIFCFIVIILIPIYVFAINIECNIFSKDKTYNLEKSDYIVLEIELGDFTSISEDIPLGYSAVLEYNKSIFENVSIVGKNGWNVVYNDKTNIILCDTAEAKANTTIAEITLKINKENVEQKENTTINFNDIILTDGDVEIKSNKQVDVELINDDIDQDIPEVQKITNYSMVIGENPILVDTSSVEEKELPEAGIENIVIICLIIILIVSILSFIRYKMIRIKEY